MQIKAGQEQAYDQWLHQKPDDDYWDDYVQAAIAFTQRWADDMEHALANGEKLADVFTPLSHKADKERITGFMFGMAVGALAEFWVYGEELRQLHNARYHQDGEGVVNPALIHISD